MAARKGNKVALKAKKPKKTRQGNGTHSKFPGKGSDPSKIYEDEIQEVTKDNLNLSRHFTELSQDHQRLFEDLVTAGYNLALQDALDPEVLEETAALSREMSDQLSSFSGLVKGFLIAKKLESED
jgi:hypothetical protein